MESRYEKNYRNSIFNKKYYIITKNSVMPILLAFQYKLLIENIIQKIFVEIIVSCYFFINISTT